MEQKMLIKYRVPTSFGQALASAVAATVAAALLPVRQLYKAVKHRRHIAVLANLDQRLLADIGLTRADVGDAVRQPIWRDPTELLSRRARAARAERRAAGLRAWLSIDNENRRALAGLDDSQLHNLSDLGCQVRRDARQKRMVRNEAA
jgi:uncharacterized protein YjiS (DUF1127 family)